MINYDLMNLMGGGAMGPTPQVTPGGGGGGGVDWNLLSMMAGGLGQAIASPYEDDPWAQAIAGIGGMGAKFGQSRKYAQAATKAGAERKANWDWLRSIMSGTPTPQGMEGVTSMKVGRAGEGKLPEVTLGLTPPRDIYDELFSGAGESVSPGVTEPIGPRGLSHYGETPESVGIGGAGGRSATHPFFKGLPEAGLQQPIW